jgi:hypothetical protein
MEANGRWSMIHSNYQAKASSTLAPTGDRTYEAGHLRSLWGRDVWREGAPGPGVGSWIELTPVVPKPLLAIHLTSMERDYPESPDPELHPRPKKVRVELNGEHTFDAEVRSPESAAIWVRGYQKAVERIRITMLVVHPGKQSEDLQINGISLQVALEGKPPIRTSIR